MTGSVLACLRHDWQFATDNPHWSLNGYLAAIRGGEVVTRTFDGRTLRFAYLENVLQF